MMRCLGAPQRQILALFALQFLVLGVGASVAGCASRSAASSCWSFCCGDRQRGPAVARPHGRQSPASASGLADAARLCAAAAVRALARRRRCACCAATCGLPRAGGSLAYALGAATIAVLIGWQAQDATTGAIMIGGIGRAARGRRRGRVGADRAFAAAAAARVQLAVRPGQSAPPAAGVEPADRRARRWG